MQSTLTQISPLRGLPSTFIDRGLFIGARGGGVSMWTPINVQNSSKPPQYDMRGAEGRSLHLFPRTVDKCFLSERPEDHMQPRTGQGAERSRHHRPCSVTAASSSSKQATPFPRNTKQNPRLLRQSVTEGCAQLSLPPMLGIPLQASIKPAPSLAPARPPTSEYKALQSDLPKFAGHPPTPPCSKQFTSTLSFDTPCPPLSPPFTLPSPSTSNSNSTPPLNQQGSNRIAMEARTSSYGQHDGRGSYRLKRTAEDAFASNHYQDMGNYTTSPLDYRSGLRWPTPAKRTAAQEADPRVVVSHQNIQLPPISTLLNMHPSPSSQGFRHQPQPLPFLLPGPPSSLLGYPKFLPPPYPTQPTSRQNHLSGSMSPAKLQEPKPSGIPTPEQSRRPSGQSQPAFEEKASTDQSLNVQSREGLPASHQEGENSYPELGYGIRQANEPFRQISRRTISESEKRARKAAQQQHRRKFGPTREARERFSKAEDKWLVMEKRRLEKEPNKHWTDLEYAHKAKFPDKNFRTLSGLQSRYYRIKKKYDSCEPAPREDASDSQEHTSSWDQDLKSEIIEADTAADDDFNSDGEL